MLIRSEKYGVRGGAAKAASMSARASGCVRAHPASWRASASYRPLRAVWAFAPGHSGVLSEITRPFSAQ